ncbi:multi-sensor signal transduction histidine kinase [Scytonema sp. HK-05]|uniref:ATP-binding protein n=1 Tax=Scytonema sp. HK-05 TaxID=1137095 RepID=UPI000937C272|nr:ATP-binding protein [Scytonema sp. HK-05]OKH57970.1 PAS domain-containing sensor histidine kinase [Scytonema sp. HK-05]BAY47480.1 multi-sensor signal transduction histidine kinase [Scytonema sp. HK-05]
MATIFRFLHNLVTAKRNPLHSLRTRLGLAIGGVAFVLSILASLIVGHTTSEQVKVDVGQSLAQIAYQMADKLDRGMFERYRDIQIISALDIIRNPDSVSQQRTLLEKLQSTYTDYAWIGLTDNKGIVQASTRKLLEGKDVSQRPWFIYGRRATYIGDVHDAVKLAKLLPNPTDEPLRFVDIAVPVMNLQGQPQGVLAAHLSWTWSKEVEKSLLRSVEQRDKEMFVLSQNGNVLLAPPKFHGVNSLSLKSIKAAQRGINGYLIENWSDNHTYLTGYAQSVGYRNYPGLGWLVLVRQKTDVAFAHIRHIQQQIFIANMILGILFAVLGWLVTAAITNPMLAIAKAANYIRQGHKQVKIPVLQGQDEIANLSRNISQLVFTLTQQEKDLKASNTQLQVELTSKLLAQEMLRQSEEKFRQLAENIQEVFWLQDFKTSKIIYISPAYEQMWQRSCESLYANPNSWLEPVHPEDKERVIINIQNNAYSTYHNEYRIVLPDGSLRWIWDSSFPVYNHLGEVYRRVGIAQDITERKLAEKTRLALEKEREISKLKSDFIAIASHEFRTPLTTILLSCDFLQNCGDKLSYEKKERHYNRIKSSVKHLTQILEDVLIIGKTEAGKLKFEPTPIDLISLCLDLVEQLQLSAGEKYHLNFVEQCVYGCKREDLPVMDEKLLRHILTNLLSNAIKYSPQGGTILFELICNHKSVIFRIQDEGIGIPEEDQSKLFTSFFRSSNTGNLPGTGLGLTIVKNAVELHGGQITLESQVGVGTTFTVILPLNKTVAVEKILTKGSG